MASILLASDDARTRIGVGGALERAGHRVDRVTHPRLAAEHVDLRDLGAVVVGLAQPLRCEDFVRRVRARHAAIPVVVLVDSLTTWQAPRLEAAGATMVLAKPFEVAELVERLGCLAAGGQRERPLTGRPRLPAMRWRADRPTRVPAPA